MNTERTPIYDTVKEEFLEWVKHADIIPDQLFTLTVGPLSVKTKEELPDDYEADIEFTWKYIEELEASMTVYHPRSAFYMYNFPEYVELEELRIVSERSPSPTSNSPTFTNQ